MLEAVIFDFDGVLVDSERLHYEAFNRVLTRFNLHISTDEYYDKFLGLSDEEVLRVVDKEKKLSLPNQRFTKLLDEKAQIFKEMITEAGIIEGVPQFLNRLAGEKVPMAICSGSLLAEIEMILTSTGLRGYFEAIVSAEQVDRGKPDPQGFLLSLELLNKKLNKSIRSGDCVVIEDSHWGLEAANAAGMHAVAITNTYAAEHLKPADKVIAHLNDLSLADLKNICD